MTQPIDVVYVELRATGEERAARDVREAVRDIRRDVERASRDVERNVSDAFANVAEAADEALGDVRDEIAETARAFEGVRAEIARIDAELRRLAQTFDRTGDRGLIDQIKSLRSARRELADIGKLAGDADSEIRSGLIQSLARVGTTLRGISVLLPSPLVAGLIAAVPAIIALGGALADLLPLALLLPAAITTLVAVLVPLKLAFTGVGAAVEALASGDLDKIKEAMRDLSPSARAFARELDRLQRPIRRLRRAVQEAFFSEFRGALTRLAKNSLPTLRRGLSTVGEALGRLGRRIAATLGSKRVLGSLDDVFAGVGRIIDRIGPSVSRFLKAFFGAAERGMPFIERAFGAFGTGLGKLAGWLDRITKDGSFDRFLEDAIATFKDLIELGKALGGLLQAVFGDAGDEGRTFIQSLTAGVKELTEFLRSPQGRDIIQRLLDSLPVLLQMLATAVTVVAFFTSMLETWFQALERVGQAVRSLTQGDLAGFMSKFREIAPAVLIAVGPIATLFIGNLERLWNWLKRVASAVDSFKFAVASGMITAANAVTGAVNWMIGQLGRLILWFGSLPGRVRGALLSLAIVIISAFNAARAAALARAASLVNGVVAFLRSLPGRARGAVVGIIGTVGGVMSAMRGRAVSVALAAVSGIAGAFTGLPGRVGGLVSAMAGRVRGILGGLAGSAFSIGRAIINGIANGISSGVGFVAALARQAAARIVAGFKSALGIGSPSRVFAREVGREIPAGIRVGVEAGEPDLRDVINSLTSRVTVSASRTAVDPTTSRTAGEGAAPPGTPGSGTVEVRVFIGERELTDLVKVVVKERDRDTRSRVTAGAGARG